MKLEFAYAERVGNRVVVVVSEPTLHITRPDTVPVMLRQPEPMHARNGRSVERIYGARTKNRHLRRSRLDGTNGRWTCGVFAGDDQPVVIARHATRRMARKLKIRLQEAW